MLRSKSIFFTALTCYLSACSLSFAQVPVTATKVTSVTLTCNRQRHFSAPGKASIATDAIGNWLVAGVPGGNDQVGTITPSGLYTAPRMAPGSDVEIALSDRSSGRTRVIAKVSIVEDPAVEDAHLRWLAGVAAAAVQHGCDPNLIQQAPTESVGDAVKIYLSAASEHTCLVLQPVSADPGPMRYSFASGGEVDGIDIVYISDVSRMRIWNGQEIRPVQ